MGKDSRISWCHHSQNFWIGCTKISAGCAHCYAEAQQDHLYHRVKWGKGQERKMTKTWGEPIKWNREARDRGIRFRVFTNSLADMFDEEVPDSWRDKAFEVIATCESLDWLILTKRVQKALDYSLTKDWWPLKNVWLGASVENQEANDYRMPILLNTPASIHFASVEPMLEPIKLDFGDKSESGVKLDWVICGGESGEGFRRMRPDWAMNLFAQCQAAGTAFYMKQASSIYNESKGDIPNGLWDVKEFPSPRHV